MACVCKVHIFNTHSLVTRALPSFGTPRFSKTTHNFTHNFWWKLMKFDENQWREKICKLWILLLKCRYYRAKLLTMRSPLGSTNFQSLAIAGLFLSKTLYSYEQPQLQATGVPQQIVRLNRWNRWNNMKYDEKPKPLNPM